MKISPIISVVISTYNQEEYLGECIKSLIDDLDNIDSEIIIADDCSTDQTTKIAKFYADHYPKLIHLMTSEINLGANKNYLRAHAAARGKYVAHIDGDDISKSGKLYRQLCIMESNSNVNLVLHSAEYFSNSGEAVLYTGIANPKSAQWFFSRSELACWGAIAVHSSFMYRRSSLKINEISPPFMEWSIAMDCLLNGRGVFINERLVRYRYNPGGNAWTSSAQGRAITYDIQWQNVLKLFNCFPSLRKNLYAQVFTNAIAIIKSKGKVPRGMLFWLLRHFSCFKPSFIVSSLFFRYTLAPRPIKND